MADSTDQRARHIPRPGETLSHRRTLGRTTDGRSREPMEEYEFTCPDCEQRIELNGPMREATLSNGCPVCGASVHPEHFVET